MIKRNDHLLHTPTTEIMDKSNNGILKIPSVKCRSTCYSPVFNPKYLGEKIRNVFKTVRIGDRIYDHEAVSFSHVLLAHSAELLLASRIQHYIKTQR